jgi:membrane protease YdiL (CAAX protease family)
LEETTIKHTAPFKNVSPIVYVFLGLTLVFFLYQIIGGLIQYAAVGEDFSSTGGKLTVTRIIITFSQFMFILFPAVLLIYLQGDKINDAFRLKPPKVSVFVLSIIGVLVVQPFLQFFMYYQNKIIFSLPFGQEGLKQLKDFFELLESSTLKLVTAYSFPEFLAIVIVIAITPAICEEFLFRGFVLSNFEKVTKPAAAIFFSGLLFALFHFHPFNLIPLIILGVYLSFTVYHSGSIYTAIICHFINNFISAVAVYVYGREEFISKEIPEGEVMQVVLLGITSLLFFIGIIILIKKKSASKKTLEADTSEFNTTIIE